MQRLRALFPLLLALATPSQAQRTAAPEMEVDPLATFFRLSALLGSRQDSLTARFPVFAPDASQRASLRLTAADRLVVTFGPARDTRDAVLRVTGVQLVRTLPDTGALRRTHAVAMAQLRSRFGAPSACTDPLGAPAHLYVPQQVTRLWPADGQRAPVRLTWSVSADALPEVVVASGSSGTTDERTWPCEVRLP